MLLHERTLHLYNRMVELTKIGPGATSFEDWISIGSYMRKDVIRVRLGILKGHINFTRIRIDALQERKKELIRMIDYVDTTP